MKIIDEAITNVFPKVNPNDLTLETKLSDIEDWDSMNAVNLIVELQELSGRTDLELDFNAETTIGNVIDELKERETQD